MHHPPQPVDGLASAGAACAACHLSFPNTASLVQHIIQTAHCLSPCPECGAFVAPVEIVEHIQQALDEIDSVPSLQGTSEASACLVHNVVRPEHEHSAQLTLSVSENVSRTDPVSLDESDLSASRRASRGDNPASRDTLSAAVAPAVSYRCMCCLNAFPTWTRLTKHVDSTDHTLTKCAVCMRSLKCYGPLRPHRHTESTGHTGLWGAFYSRQDYVITDRSQRTLFTAENYFTGHSVLQFECTCGLRYVNEVDLAMHLIGAHHVRCIAETAVCSACSFSGSLPDMARHLTMTLDVDSDDAVRHTPRIDGFNAFSFLAHRPLAAVGSGLGGWASLSDLPSSATPDGSSPFIVLYQCPLCYLLFSTWEKVEQHIQLTGHCRSYCVDCQRVLPTLRNFGEGAASRSDNQSSLSYQSGYSHSSMSARDYLGHIRRHTNVLGCPASREAFEVLYHRRLGTTMLTACAPQAPNAPALTDQLDVPVSTQQQDVAKHDPECLAYQCSTCQAVFLHFGELAHHFVTLRHGDRLRGTEDGNELVLESVLPMVTYQVKFTSTQLCQNFGFVPCSACHHVFPPHAMPLHEALCQERWMTRQAGSVAAVDHGAVDA